jgi:hypothetical protein
MWKMCLFNVHGEWVTMKENIKTDLIATDCSSMGCIHVGCTKWSDLLEKLSNWWLFKDSAVQSYNSIFQAGTCCIFPLRWPLPATLPDAQPPKKFPAFYGTWRFITVFTRALHWSLYLSRLIHFHIIPSYVSKIHLGITTHLYLCLPSGLFPTITYLQSSSPQLPPFVLLFLPISSSLTSLL